jgi:hypothetical protein
MNMRKSEMISLLNFHWQIYIYMKLGIQMDVFYRLFIIHFLKLSHTNMGNIQMAQRYI